MTLKRGRGRPGGRDDATRYADAVREGKIIAGPWVHKACERHLYELDHQSEMGLVWQWGDRLAPDTPADVISFFAEALHHGDLEFVGQPFELLPWQKFIIGNLYGWRRVVSDPKTGEITTPKRYRVAYIEAGKGCGKTPLVAG